jgi:hypothetical protein
MPIPTVRLDLELPPVTFRVDPQRVHTQYLSVPGVAAPETPEALNQSFYLRYFYRDEAPQAVLILIPGIFGGATSLDLFARQLVAANPGLEVWAIDRRANALEDRSAMVQSLLLRDPMIAYDYYVTNYGTTEGFRPLQAEDVPFMRHWGLSVHLGDLHAVVMRARQQVDTVLLGGHSLGAAMAGFYAAARFEDGVGQDYLEGLVLLDGALGRTGGYERLPTGIGLGALELIPGAEALQAGRGKPFIDLVIGPRFFARRETAGLLARFLPDELSPGGYWDFPITNLAALAIGEDDQYGPSTAFSSSWGEAVGARFAGNLTAFILGGVQGARSQTVVGVAEGYDYVSWQRGDPAREHVDITQMVRGWSTLETNRSEWYFPVALALDIGELSVALIDKDDFVPNAQVTLPTLAIGAGRGLIPTLSGFEAYLNARPGSLFSIHIVPGFTHFDIVQAEVNPAVSLFKLWFERLFR